MKSQGVLNKILIMRIIKREKIKNEPMPRLPNMVELQTRLLRKCVFCLIQTSHMFLKSSVFKNVFV
jgi:hypothetical protein